MATVIGSVDLSRTFAGGLMLEVEDNHGELLDKVKLERLLTISQIAKSIGAYATQGSQLAADGLLIRQLMEKLKEGEG